MRKVFPLVLFFYVLTLSSQNQTNTWYFGENAGINFTSNSPSAIVDGYVNTLEGCATYSDENGNLLFYSDGSTVWNKQHQILQYTNGSLANNLLGNTSSTQSALIVPHPGNQNLFYLFTVDDLTGSDGLNVYTVDISKNNGLGEVIAGPVDLSINSNYKANWSERLTAVQASSCNSYWLVSQTGNTFVSYKINETGLNQTPILSATNYTPEEKGGYLKISPDGTKLAIADAQHYEDNYGVVIYDFNDTTGQVSQNGELISTKIEDGIPYGIEFSKTSNKLYVSTYSYFRNSLNDATPSTYKLLQFDVNSSPVKPTKQVVYTDNNGFRGALQLATDGKIYATIPKAYFNGGVNYLSVIENPDTEAENVIFTKNAVNLNGKKATQGLPPFIQSYFASTTIVDNATNEVLSDTTQTFFLQDQHVLRSGTEENGATYKWTKDGNVIGNTITLDVSNGTFGDGLYKLEVTLPNCKKLTATVSITFEETQDVSYYNCDNDANTTDGITTFNLSSVSGEFGENTTTVEYFEKDDTTFTNPLADEYRNENNPVEHELNARITRDNGTQCIETLQLRVIPSTSTSNLPTLYVVEEDLNANNSDAMYSLGSDEASVDFTNQINKIKDIYSSFSVDVKLYTNNQDANNNENEITPPYTNYTFTDNSEIFVRLFFNGESCNNSIGTFTIKLYKLPEPLGSEDPIGLCQKSEVLNGTTDVFEDTYKWYLNGRLIENATQETYNATEAGVYKVEAYRTYTGLPNPVVGYNSFIVEESETPIIESLVYNNDNSLIEVAMTGSGEYQYSLDNINFETNLNSHTFPIDENGLYTVYVKNGCGKTIQQEVSVLKIQNFLTPNNDGIKDTWKIDISRNTNYQSVEVVIFNRYGKIIKTLKGDSWDGTYQGKYLPPKTYWYIAKFRGNDGAITEAKGGISLIRN